MTKSFSSTSHNNKIFSVQYEETTVTWYQEVKSCISYVASQHFSKHAVEFCTFLIDWLINRCICQAVSRLWCVLCCVQVRWDWSEWWETLWVHVIWAGRVCSDCVTLQTFSLHLITLSFVCSVYIHPQETGNYSHMTWISCWPVTLKRLMWAVVVDS